MPTRFYCGVVCTVAILLSCLPVQLPPSECQSRSLVFQPTETDAAVGDTIVWDQS